jgi:CheY-specific phosphatase CheX
MPVSGIDRLLEEAASEVLETMFFTGLSEGDEAIPSLQEPLVCTRVEFRGTPSGRLGIRVPVETGRQIAANFLGDDAGEIAEGRMAEVICELSNMVCGSVLSRLERESVFELLHPEIEPPETAGPRDNQAVRCSLVLEEGVMEVWFELEPTP